MNLKRKIFLSVFGLVCCSLFAQKKVIQYTKNFTFREGIYLSFSDFQNNSPIPVSGIISDYNQNDRDFIEKVLSKNSVLYSDTNGKEFTVKTSDLWGFCRNGTVYINHGTDFVRMNIIGSICHFIATVAVQTGYDPYYYNDPFGNPYPRYTYISSQYILDFEFGKVLEFTVENMEAVLQRDAELYKEFLALKKRKKRDSIFLYLRKYNEKHPIFFPI